MTDQPEEGELFGDLPQQKAPIAVPAGPHVKVRCQACKGRGRRLVAKRGQFRNLTCRACNGAGGRLVRIGRRKG